MMCKRFAAALAAAAALVVLTGYGKHPCEFGGCGPLNPVLRVPFETSTSRNRGTADPTFTRASVSSRINAGLYETVTTGTAAITQVIDSDGTLPSTSAAYGVHIGEAVTFDLLGSSAFNGIVWTNVGSPTVTADQSADVFGNTTCDNIEDDGSGTLEGRQQTVAGILSPNETVTASVWVRCSSPHAVSLRVTLTGGDTPVVVTENATCSSALQKLVAEATNNNTATDNTDVVVAVYPTTVTPADVANADFCNAALYQEPFESLREEDVGGSAEAVNAELLSYTPVGGLSPGNAGTVSFWLWHSRDDVAMGLVDWADGTDDLFLLLGADGTLSLETTGLADNLKLSTSTTVPEKTWTHVCFAYQQSSAMANIFVNGSEATYSDPVDSWTVDGDYGDELALGSRAGSVNGEMVFARLHVWATGRYLPNYCRSFYGREHGRFASQL